MRVLLTGNRGALGTVVESALLAAGHDVSGFDLETGQDVRDAAAVRAAAVQQDAIVHLAGLPGDQEDRAGEVMAINLVGTWNVLLAARAASVRRVVYASSGKALGMLERDPEYLPVDDAHPGLPSGSYALSKWLAEEMCAAFTRETGIASICLRPVFVADEAAWARLSDLSALPPARGAAWHLGVVVDVRDVAEAFVAALACSDPGHVRLLLCADDIADDRPTAQVVAERLPGVPWPAGRPDDASRAALVDCSAARAVLGWRPRYSWSTRGGLR